MATPNTGHAWLTLLALGLSLGACGCTCQTARHGCVVSGNWSMEFNRVPWRQEATCRSGTCEPCGSLSECDGIETGSAPAARPTKADGTVGGPGRLPCRTCEQVAHRGIAPGPPEPPPTAGYHNHPRFHPVPVQPVFSPRVGPLAMTDEASQHAAPTSGDKSAIEPDPLTAPLPPEPEVIPPPPPSRENGESSGSGKIAKSRAEPSWVFLPSSETRGAKPVRAVAAGTANSATATR